jgi:pantoate--beta-alanine ligase
VQQLSTLSLWRDATRQARARGQSVGLVPTMGALHRGHEALITAARERCDEVVVTIFVNPLQFGSRDDLELYPRPLSADLALCETLGVDFVATPAVSEMWPNYPTSEVTSVVVPALSDLWEGEQRPGHFTGVASVVTKIFSVTGECTAFFGEKDFQQLAVIRRLVDDLALPVTVVGCATVRESDGLALSSRNVRLSSSGRSQALGLSRALSELATSQRRSVSEARSLMQQLLKEHDVQIGYAEVVDPLTLRAWSDEDHGDARAIIAGIVDGVRLLDNGPVTIMRAEESRAAGH